MKPAPRPATEPARLEALRAYNQVGELTESALNELAALAAQIVGTPIALITLVDDEHQWFKAVIGMTPGEISRDVSFCAHAILQPDVFVVPDAALDDRFADNPLVTGDPRIRFYAGAPLVTPDGHALGALCVIDRVPRELTPAQHDALRVLSRQVMAQLELRRQTREVVDSEARLFKVFSHSPVAMSVHRWSDGTCVDVNAAFTTLTGFTRDEIAGRRTDEIGLVTESDARHLRAVLERFAAYDGDIAVTTRDGERRQVLVGVVLEDLRGEMHAITTFVDITERKQAEGALRESEERLRLALEAARMGTFDWDMCRDRITWSSWHEELWGFQPGEFDGTYAGFASRIHRDDVASIDTELVRCIAARDAFVAEFRVVWGDGSVHWMAARGECVFDAEGAATSMRGAVLEVTHRKQAEATLQSSHERFQLVTRATNDAVWDWNLGSGSLWWNDGYQALFGYSPRETEPTLDSWTRHIHEDDVERVTHSIHESIDHGGHSWSSEYRFRRRDGTYADIFDRGYIIRDPDGTPTRMIGAMQDVTARKQAESEARQLALRLKLATDSAAIGVWDWDVDADTWQASDMYYTMLGYTPAEGIADRNFWMGKLHPDDKAAVTARIQSVIDGPIESYEYEAWMRHADGSYRWISVIGRVLARDQRGRASRLLGVSMEATERKRALEERQHIFERITDGFVALDREWRFTFVNPKAAQIFGRRAEDLTGRPIWPELPRDLADTLRAASERALADQAQACLEAYYRSADRWFENRIYPSADGVSIYFQDISERRSAELQIRRLNRVHAVLSSINQTIVRVKDAQTLLTLACEIAVSKGEFRMAWIGSWNEAEERMTISASAGASAETLEVLRALIGTEKGECRCTYTMDALTTGQHSACNDIAADPLAAPWRNEALARGYLSMVSLPLRVSGRLTGTFNFYSGEAGFFDAEELGLLDALAGDIGFALDVQEREAERQRIEHALEESEDRFRQLAETIQEVFWMTDVTRSEVLYISPAYEAIWGRTCARLYEFPGDWEAAIVPEDRARVAHALATKQLGGEYDETYRITRPDGSVRWIHDRAFPVRDPDGAIHRIVGTAEDITEARQLEEQYRQSQKMEAIGQLAGGVAHDFNNILAAIMMQAELGVTTLDSPQETRELLDGIISATERAASLTRQLLAFGRRQVMQPRQLDLNHVVTNIARMLERILGDDVHMLLNLDAGPLQTRGDAGMLDQVLLNLVINARDAMPNGGVVHIETASVTLTENDAASYTGAVAGRYVCLRVRDSGTGIAVEHMSRIFEPFFTTKDPGKGTGLGLATVFGITRQHGGALRVASEPGRATIFELLLPATEAEIAPRERALRPSMQRGGTETILLVEDDPSVRKLTRVVLERAGYTVFDAPDGASALLLWEEVRESVSLLLTDIVMPGGVGGRELAARLKKHSPHLRVVFTSGYSADVAGRELSLDEGRNFIQKPSVPQALLDTVRRCLDD